MGSNNVAIGTAAGELATGSSNVFIGYNAGKNETGANKLYIANSNTATPLIYGDFAAGALTINGTLSASTLLVGVESTSPSGSCTNGSIKISSSATTPGIYYCYGDVWHYSDQTSGFQIPNYESTDPVTGEQMQVGDFVIPMVDKVFEDGTAHGIWAKWNTVKAQLLAELTSNGDIGSGAISTINIDKTSLTEKITDALALLGISIVDGVTNITELATTHFSAQTADIGQMQMTDKITGDKYCIWLANGDWQKVKGECGSPQVAAAMSAPMPSVTEITSDTPNTTEPENTFTQTETSDNPSTQLDVNATTTPTDESIQNNHNTENLIEQATSAVLNGGMNFAKWLYRTFAAIP